MLKDINIAEEARKLENCIDNCLFLSEGAKVTPELINCVNSVAERFGVIGGDFGVFNIEKNLFELHRYYGDEKPYYPEDYLFPYIWPDKSDRKGTLSLEQGFTKSSYSEWIHSLFHVQREGQHIRKGNEFDQNLAIQVPEFFSHFTGSSEAEGKASLSPLIISSGDIKENIRRWVAIWLLASECEQGLCSTIKEACDLSKDFDDRSIFKAVKLANGKSAGLEKAIRSSLVESKFFLRDRPSEPGIRHAREVARDTRCMRDILGTHHPRKACYKFLQQLTTNDGSEEARNGESPLFEKSLLWLLIRLHETAGHPIVPYFYLNLDDKRELWHFVLPVLKTKEFEVEVEVFSDNSTKKKQEVACGMVMLGTLAVESGSPESKLEEQQKNDVESHLRVFSLLMRLVAEPIADSVFHGSIQRNVQIKTGRKESFKELYRTLSHELGPLQERLLDTWLFDIQKVCSEVPPECSGLKVITVPKVYEMVSDKFMLWTNKGWLERKHLDHSHSKKGSRVLSLLDVLKVLTRCSANSQTVGDGTHIYSKGLSNLNTAAEESEGVLSEADEMFSRFEFSDEGAMQHIEWMPASESSNEGAVNFCRLFVSIASNSLKNSRNGKITTSVDYKNGWLRLKQTNPLEQDFDLAEYDEKKASKEGGTKAVMRFLVGLLDGQEERLRFEPDVADQLWVAEIAIPVDFLSSSETRD